MPIGDLEQIPAASFTYFGNNDEAAQWKNNENAIEGDDQEELSFDEFDVDLEDGRQSIGRRRSSAVSRPSAEDPLLHRHDSARTDISGLGQQGRLSQKIYILPEDLTIVVAGFSTHTIGSTLLPAALRTDLGSCISRISLATKVAGPIGRGAYTNQGLYLGCCRGRFRRFNATIPILTHIEPMGRTCCHQCQEATLRKEHVHRIWAF